MSLGEQIFGMRYAAVLWDRERARLPKVVGSGHPAHPAPIGWARANERDGTTMAPAEADKTQGLPLPPPRAGRSPDQRAADVYFAARRSGPGRRAVRVASVRAPDIIVSLVMS
jgi:hypothetical protein